MPAAYHALTDPVGAALDLYPAATGSGTRLQVDLKKVRKWIRFRAPLKRLLLATGFARLLMHSNTWQRLLFQAHPDHLLTLLTGLAVYGSIRWWREPTDTSKLRLASWAWGLALATKSSTLLYLPFVVGSVLYQAPVHRMKTTCRFAGHLALAYFIIGFPQNFHLQRTIEFLRAQSNYSRPATLQSVQQWLTTYAEQAYGPMLLLAGILLVLWLAGRTMQQRAHSRPFVCAVGLAVGPALLLLVQDILPPHNHYVMPLLATHLVLLLSMGVTRNISWDVGRVLVAFASAFVFIEMSGLVPMTLVHAMGRELECRPAARAMYSIVKSYQNNGQDIYIDPYIPAKRIENHVSTSWETSKSSIAGHPYAALMLNRRYFRRYWDDSMGNYIDVYNPQSKSSREFYELFKNGTLVDDPVIGSWKREFLDACGNEVWTPYTTPHETSQ